MRKTMKGGNNNVYDASGQTPWYKAVDTNNIAKVQDLLAKNVNVNKGYNKNGTRIAPLHVSCFKGYLEITKLLLQAPGINTNILTNSGLTPLFLACQKGHSDIVKELLAKEEIDVNYPVTDALTTPLHIACVNNHLSVVEELVKDPRIEINRINRMGISALYMACQGKYLDIVKALLSKEGINVNRNTNGGETPLFIACARNAPDIVEELLKQPTIDINKPDINNQSPLFIASQYGFINVVKLLLAKNTIDVNNKNASGKGTSPLYTAIINHHPDIIDELVKHPSIDVNIETHFGISCIYAACEHDDIATVRKLTSHPKFVLDAKTQADISSFSPEIQTILTNYSKKTNVDNLWPGFSKTDSEKLGLLFDEKVHPNQLTQLPTNGQETLYSHCPICLKYVSHGEATCMYMSHNCSELPGFYHASLFKKYKHKVTNIMGIETQREVVSWCTLCGRICKGHQHYKLDSYMAVTPILLPPGAPYESDCRKTNGGGGWPEKAARHRRLREYALELNEQVGEITTDEALTQLVEEMWNAPLRREVRLVGKMATEKKYVNIGHEEFPNLPYNQFPNVPNAPTFQKGQMISDTTFKIGTQTFTVKDDILYTNNAGTTKAAAPYQQYFKKFRNIAAAAAAANTETNVPYPNAGDANLLPIVYPEAPEGFVDPTGSGDEENVIQFRHRMADGSINKHENPATDMISKDMLFLKIASALNNGELENIGPCWKSDCTALLYPQELKAVIDASEYVGVAGEAQKKDDIKTYERYRYEFNKKYKQ